MQLLYIASYSFKCYSMVSRKRYVCIYLLAVFKWGKVVNHVSCLHGSISYTFFHLKANVTNLAVVTLSTQYNLYTLTNNNIAGK